MERYIDSDYNGDMREVLEEFDYTPETGPDPDSYVVEMWGITGFDTVRRFTDYEDAVEFAKSEAKVTQGRYRVMGPKMSYPEAMELTRKRMEEK